MRRSDERPFRIILERLDGIEAQIMKDASEISSNPEQPEESQHFSNQNIMVDEAVERSA